jgi:hypothetical protein
VDKLLKRIANDTRFRAAVAMHAVALKEEVQQWGIFAATLGQVRIGKREFVFGLTNGNAFGVEERINGMPSEQPLFENGRRVPGVKVLRGLQTILEFDEHGRAFAELEGSDKRYIGGILPQHGGIDPVKLGTDYQLIRMTVMDIAHAVEFQGRIWS